MHNIRRSYFLILPFLSKNLHKIHHHISAKPHYESALKQSGKDKKLTYTEYKKPVTHTIQNSRKNRERNIIWFNPPYSMNVQTNIGREFLNLVSKHFPKNHRYRKIFNKNNMKVSYSCTDGILIF